MTIAAIAMDHRVDGAQFTRQALAGVDIWRQWLLAHGHIIALYWRCDIDLNQGNRKKAKA